MSCWVVPAIAAELWGVSINHVLAGVRDGSFASRHEHGFVFVDVAPGGYTYQRPRRPDEPIPQTFVLVQPPEPEELASLDPVQQDNPAGEVSSEELASLARMSPTAVEDDELPPLDLEEDDTPLPPRDAVRSAVARQRRRPLAA